MPAMMINKLLLLLLLLLLPTFRMLLKAMPSCFLLLCPLLLMQPSVCFPTLLPARANETDRLSLLAFKAQILDDPQNALRSWNESSHFCEWSGVTCGRRHQRVVELDLRSRQLKGRLTPHIGNLSFLRMIDLANNSFSQEIPRQIGRLFRLQFLYLTNNTFTGEIPVNISRCSKLIGLFLGGNKLAGELPVELGSFSRLQILVFQKNNLAAHVGDFGLARILRDSTIQSPLDNNSSIGVKGTIGYVAPEYGMGSNASTSGDIYSYGILLLEIFTGKRPTEAIFIDGLNLYTFVESAFRKGLEEVIDPILVREELKTSICSSTKVNQVNKDKILESFASIFEVGLACSAEFPENRININNVVTQLQQIKRTLLGKRRYGLT